MNFQPGTLSADGYIIDQRRTDNILFGQVPSSKNGCGWIAVYNLLRALGQDPDPDAIVSQLQKTLLFGGTLGLNFFVLAHYLRRLGLNMEVAVRSFHARELSEHCTAGIVLYRAGRTNHFAAFRREENGKLRFFGAIPGDENYRATMAEFYYDKVKFPLALTITVK